MDVFLSEFFNVDIMVKVAPLIFKGFLQTLLLCVILVPIGLCGGLGAMLLATSRSRFVRWPAVAAIDFFRSFPPLVLLIFIYSGLPFAGIRLSPLAAICIAFLLNAASYYGEIYRAGVESVPRGQVEAGRSTGLGAAQTFLYITLPQAVRNVLPELLSNTVELIKLTTLASVISAPELLHSADLARSLTYNTSPLIMAAALYLIMLWPLVRIIRRLEHKLAG
ncbi:amino acid ABC transporter permease [Microvirga pudoricolor]|uniref:amino acid ABC transporter permease n=1 Tax=Microvirga pudoricolor TaxID=2778729 RepID=UPI00194EA1A7|nr:amino acid ABC transporter permease [Microvirga pudoricolor]MBM6596337.1 amino acid ABC transporter permease [Microvirga pudoricolor]